MNQYLENYFGKDRIQKIEAIAQAGSDRKYFRVWVNNQTFIACESANVQENETFFYFSEFFKGCEISVPQILNISEDRTCYLLEDVGVESLLDRLLKEGYNDLLKQLYLKSISALVQMQIQGAERLDFSKCYNTASFDKNAIVADLNYFKYYFLDLQKVAYNKVLLNDEFEQLAKQLDRHSPLYFMYRDFQGRNIMIKNDEPFFIDYQGGMKGPLQYDIASLLWQAKAQLPASWKDELYTHYKSELKKLINIDEPIFDQQYQYIVLIRLLQVLGAYGLRGLIEKRAHFLSSIPLGLKNIEEWLQHYSLAAYPELSAVLQQLCTQKMNHTEPKLSTDSKLKICIQSFSYKKGIPEDSSGNGGGFMFDCRGILNPGRFEAYKKLTGRDQSVIDFLESKTKVNEFLEHAKRIVDISVQDYLQRGFENLQISFGCTGGQHRSVYCTDAMARYLNETYPVEIVVRHLIQDEKNWINDTVHP